MLDVQQVHPPIRDDARTPGASRRVHARPTGPKRPRPHVNYPTVLKALRAQRSTEYGLRGYGKIADWFYEIGWSRPRPSKSTLRLWEAEAGMPVCHIRLRGKPAPWTTNLLLMAWVLAQGGKGRLHRPPWSPIAAPGPRLLGEGASAP